MTTLTLAASLSDHPPPPTTTPHKPDTHLNPTLRPAHGPQAPGWVAWAEAGPALSTSGAVWASGCAPCKLSFPWMNEMHERLSGAGLRIVAVNLDRREADAQRFLQQIPARFAVAMDPAADTARLLDIPTMPTSMLVAPDRRVLFTHRGFRLDDRADLERRLRGALY